jgi:hypothetical protein
MGPYTGYDDSIDPAVSLEFATVGTRALDSSAPGAPLEFWDDNAFPVFPVRDTAPEKCTLLHLSLFSEVVIMSIVVIRHCH